MATKAKNNYLDLNIKNLPKNKKVPIIIKENRINKEKYHIPGKHILIIYRFHLFKGLIPIHSNPNRILLFLEAVKNDSEYHLD